MKLAVDLTDFFKDHRSCAWVFVNDHMKKIRDLKKRIKTIFGISGFYLACDRRYLPPSEDIQIVTEIDSCTVKVAAKKEVLPKGRSSESSYDSKCSSVESVPHNSSNGEVDHTCNLQVKKIVDLYEKQSSCSPKDYLKKITFNPEKILNKKINIIKTIIVRSPNVTNSTDKSETVEEEPCSKVTSSLPPTNGSLAISEGSENGSFSVIPSVGEKRKRTRVRTRKPKRSSLILTPQETIIPTPRPYIAPVHNGSHIIFDSDPATNDSIPILTNGNVQETVINERLKEEPTVETTTRPKHSSIENLLDIDRKTFTDEYIMKCSVLPDFVPVKGEAVAFKVLRLSENYTPELSSYIVGIVQDYAENSSEVTFEILTGFDQCSSPVGKFSVEEGKSEEETNFIRKYSLFDLLEVKLLFP